MLEINLLTMYGGDMESLTNRQIKILKELFKANNYLTSSSLAEKAHVSIRTIKTEVNNINQILYKYDSSIESKQGSGYCLHLSEQFDESILNNDSTDGDLTNNYERIIYLIKKLLVVDYHVKIEDLADELYISRSSMTLILKEVRSHLSKYRLKLTSRSNYGILVEGNEIDKRLAISEYFFHFSDADDALSNNNMFNNEYSRHEYEEIISFIYDVINKYNLDLSDFSIHNFAIHVAIAIKRCQFYNYVIVDDNVLRDIQYSMEFKAANELVEKLERKYGFLLPIGEVVYFTEHLHSKRILEDTRLSVEETEKLKRCINVMYLEINNNFGFDFALDSELYKYLYLHIPQMVKRLKYHMTIRNPLVIDNKRRYLFATKVTHSACAVIKQYYDVEVDLNEFGYLLLYFNLAITKFETNKAIKIAILTGRGRPEAMMYSNEIREHFSSRKYEFKDVDKITQKYDLIISTYRVEQTYDSPVIIVNNDNYIEEVHSKLSEIRYHNLDINNFFKEEYTFFELDGDSREEVYQNFNKLLLSRGIIKKLPSDFDAFFDDELGNGVVHFQDSYRIVRKNLCFVCTLKKPIYWNKNLVRILVLTKTKKDCDQNLYNLCRIVSKWANDIGKINNLLKKQNFTTLLEDIKTI